MRLLDVAIACSTLLALWYVVNNIKADIRQKRALMASSPGDAGVWTLVLSGEGKVVEADDRIGLQVGNLVQDVESLFKQAGTGGGFGKLVLPSPDGDLHSFTAYIRQKNENYEVMGHTLG